MQWPTSVIKLVTCLGCKCIAQMLYRCFFFTCCVSNLFCLRVGWLHFATFFLFVVDPRIGVRSALTQSQKIGMIGGNAASLLAWTCVRSAATPLHEGCYID